MYCKRCGAEISAVKFCPKCGAPVMAMQESDEKTVAAPVADMSAAQVNSEHATVVSDAEETVAARDFDATVAAPYINGQGGIMPPAEPVFFHPDPKAEKKANKKPMSTKKKVLAAISGVLAFIILLGSVGAGVIAFTPKFKFMLALYNTVFNMKSFDVTMLREETEYIEYSGDDGDVLYHNGARWSFDSGYCTKTYRTENRMSYNLGESDRDTTACTVSEYESKKTGRGYGREVGSDGAKEYVDIKESDFNSSYSVLDDGEYISGRVLGENGYATNGSFVAGKSDAYWDYCEDNENYVPLVKNNRINPEFIENMFSNSDDDNKLEADELRKIIYDIISFAFKEGAIEIKDTRIENGMTKYDVKLDVDELEECIFDYTKENDVFKSYLRNEETDSGNLYMSLREDANKNNNDTYEFTLGTRGMRIVHFKLETEDFGEYRNASNLMEINITNINKKKDYGSQFEDIKAIAEDWKENYTYCETAADFKAHFNPVDEG